MNFTCKLNWGRCIGRYFKNTTKDLKFTGSIIFNLTVNYVTKDKVWKKLISKKKTYWNETKREQTHLRKKSESFKLYTNRQSSGRWQVYIEIIKYSYGDPLIDEIFKLFQEMYITGQILRHFQKIKWLLYLNSSSPLNVRNIIARIIFCKRAIYF